LSPAFWRNPMPDAARPEQKALLEISMGSPQ
jgi:hypothetical protein